MKIFYCYVLILTFLLGSCRGPKEIIYFQGIEELTAVEIEKMNQQYVPRICIDDLLIISVTSPTRDEVAQFAPPPFGHYMPGEAEIGISATTQNLFTYLVDENGAINFPVLGRIAVAGLSINEANRLMERLIRNTAPRAIVNVQISNFRVSILGEVRNPNSFPIKGMARMSVLELIALAGDLTIMADRKNIWIHRDNNGEKSYHRIDLTDPATFSSPYYYLQQNDIVYVRPNDAQKRNAAYSSLDPVRLSIITAIFSSLSIIISMMSTVRDW